MSPERARQVYGLSEHHSLFASELDKQLLEWGIAAIEMPLHESDFKRILDGYTVCLGECPELLQNTYYSVDDRKGSEAGHVRKERSFNASGKQTQDPKNLFHFNEKVRQRWDEQFKYGPKVLKEFLADGYEIHNALITVSKVVFEQLEETHPNISKAYFPQLQPQSAATSCSFLRLVKYDSYWADDSKLGPVAKPHRDIGGATIQAFADAPGFWGAKDGPDNERTFFDTADDSAYFFLGSGHSKLYGKQSRLKPLYHGVERIIPAGATIVPERHAIILFIDCPRVDYQTTLEDTLPELSQEADDNLRKSAGYIS